MIEVIQDNDMRCNKRYYNLLKEEELGSFTSIMNYRGGESVKEKKEVSVDRIQLKNRTFYLKRYRTSVKSSIEPLFKLKRVERDGIQEWDNICRTGNIGINTITPVAAGSRRAGLFNSESFILTEALYGARKLDEFFRENFIPPYDRGKIRFKREIIAGVAHIARRLHESLLSHQDLYLGHFYIELNPDGGFKLYLIDLQRVREARNAVTQRRYQIKDLSQLLFASHYEVFVSNLDRFRFYKTYAGGRRMNRSDQRLFDLVYKRAERIAAHTKKHSYPLPAISWDPRI